MFTIFAACWIQLLLFSDALTVRSKTRRPMSRPSRPTSTPSRPLSAIFVGNISSQPSTTPPNSGRPVQLPSPPHTHSTGSGGGSTGDSGTVGRTGIPPTMDLSRDMKGKRREPIYDNDDEDIHDTNNDNEEHTARLSDDRRSNGTSSSGGAVLKTNSSASGGAVIDRAKSLADRNRIVLDKLAAITSSSRNSASSSPQPRTIRNREATPPTPRQIETPSSASSSSSRVSFSRSRSEVEIPSGSDTEKEALSSSDDVSTTPSAASNPISSHSRESLRLSAVPSTPQTLSRTNRQFSESSNSASLARRSRRVTLGDEVDTSNIFNNSSASGFKRSPRRAPLPQEFFDSGSKSGEERVSRMFYSPLFYPSLINIGMEFRTHILLQVPRLPKSLLLIEDIDPSHSLGVSRVVHLHPLRSDISHPFVLLLLIDPFDMYALQLFVKGGGPHIHAGQVKIHRTLLVKRIVGSDLVMNNEGEALVILSSLQQLVAHL